MAKQPSPYTKQHVASNTVHLLKSKMSTETVVAACAVVVAISIRRRRRRRRNRDIWVREWIRGRPTQGVYNQLLQELRLSDPTSYKNFLRMDAGTFDELLKMVGPLITYQDTNMRKAIAPGERLALTLRFLATGETFTSLQYLYRIPAQTIGMIIPETCAALAAVLKEELKVPKTESEWEQVALQFYEQWNFPNCIGAMDGKHVMIKPPPNSGSYYFNYKHSFSIVLMAVVDADYKFIFVDIGCNGRISDGGVFKNCALSSALEQNTLNIPQPKPLPGRSRPVPFVIVADDAFPLKENLQKPYSQAGLTKEKRIINYRLSRARRIVENAFGILANRFRIFMSPIALAPEKVETIVMACCSLHNFLRRRIGARKVYTPPGSLDTEDQDTHQLSPGEWRQSPQPQGLQPLQRQGSNRHSNAAKELREYLQDYFNSEDGAVPWQNSMI